MTLLEAQNKLISVAEAEEGYLEKATNAQLDSKTANAGRNNYTKYSRDHAQWGTYHAPKQGLPWCDQFVDWCFIKAFGFDTGMKLTCQPKGGYGAGCTESYNYYKANGQTVPAANAKPGDQIFFGKIGSMTHTGIVYKVDSTKIYTIEGNTSSTANTVVANGGGVFKKWYLKTSGSIGGIGRPKWSVVTGTSDNTATVESNTTLTGVKYSDFKGGIFAEIPFSCIDRIEHVKMESASGETLGSVAVRANWNGRFPDIVINAELFNYGKYTPASGVKHKGTLEYQGWQPFIGFKNYKTPIREERGNVTSPDAVGGYPALVLDGKKDFTVPKGLEGNRYRTAIGLKGNTLGIIVTEMLVPMEVVANKFVAEKYDFAINLDGGSSSSYATPTKAWARSNKLRGFVAIWLKNGSGNYLSKKKGTAKPSAGTNAESWIAVDKTAAKGVKLKVTASELNLRAAASTSSAIKATMKNGDIVTWYGYQTQNWYYIRTANGKEGYASKSYLKVV